jgi:hypothetical protein
MLLRILLLSTGKQRDPKANCSGCSARRCAGQPVAVDSTLNAMAVGVTGRVGDPGPEQRPVIRPDQHKEHHLYPYGVDDGVYASKVTQEEFLRWHSC